VTLPNPGELGFVPSGTRGLAIAEPEVFSRDAHALHVYDVSDRSAPAAVRILPNLRAEDVAIEDQTVLVLTLESGLGIADFAGP
jgi:hypothetical protein